LMNISYTFLVLIMFSACSNPQSETELLNKKNPIGLYGKNISEDDVMNINQLLEFPSEKLGKNVSINGQIIDVCPMRGCWLQLKDINTNEEIRIKVTDGEIVFPLSAKGKNVIVKGVFTKLDFSEDQAIRWKIHLAEEKGIELDTSDIVLTENDYFEYRINAFGAKIF